MNQKIISVTVSFGISMTIAMVTRIGFNYNANQKIDLIESDSRENVIHQDSLIQKITMAEKQRKDFLNKVQMEESQWKNLEYTLTFPNSRKSVYSRIDQDFVEMCKKLGLKNSMEFYDFVDENSIKSDSIRRKHVEIKRTRIEENSIQIKGLIDEKLEIKFVVFLTLLLTILICLMDQKVNWFIKK